MNAPRPTTGYTEQKMYKTLYKGDYTAACESHEGFCDSANPALLEFQRIRHHPVRKTEADPLQSERGGALVVVGTG